MEAFDRYDQPMVGNGHNFGSEIKHFDRYDRPMAGNGHSVLLLKWKHSIVMTGMAGNGHHFASEMEHSIVMTGPWLVMSNPFAAEIEAFDRYEWPMRGNGHSILLLHWKHSIARTGPWLVIGTPFCC